MGYWYSIVFFNKFSYKGLSSGGFKGPRVKVRFVREQRIFAKGSRGPLKKRTNVLLKFLKLYISSGKLQNLPPLSTTLNLYGINVQKLCDDVNHFLKIHFFDDIPLVLNIWISKDLNFTFSIDTLRLNQLFFSLDTRFLNISNSLVSFFNKRAFFFSGSTSLFERFRIKRNFFT